MQELIVHIHFDAKYKVDNLFSVIEKTEEEQLIDLNEEKRDNRKGIYKNADLLKMHAYKDAIRRTGGAYVLYPGETSTNRKGFHEIIPGLGAFPVRPSKTDDGTGDLKSFISEVIEHFTNRTSQREKHAFRTFDIHKNGSDKDAVNDTLPETFGKNRGLYADETYVLVGYYKSQKHLDWIIERGYYNFRMNSKRGALKLTSETINARYLLLHSEKDSSSDLLLEIERNNFRVTSKSVLEKLGYPQPGQDQYMLVKVREITDKELSGLRWDFKKLNNYKSGYASALPFTCSLKELLGRKIL